ncbi:MAG: hypothetical protein D6772_07220 [Bacteroidetes bacterium]|nr:MAG: hypothetical protein D6772_07220 [Bacteroidota bacterium]
MMKLSLLIGSILLCLGPSHDVPMATFRLHQAAAEVKLDIALDAEDLAAELGTIATELGLATIEAYLQTHLQVSINGVKLTYQVQAYQLLHGHVKVWGTLSEHSGEIRTVMVKNTVLVNVADQSNILSIDVEGESRDYRMHRGRTRIVVDYRSGEVKPSNSCCGSKL